MTNPQTPTRTILIVATASVVAATAVGGALWLAAGSSDPAPAASGAPAASSEPSPEPVPVLEVDLRRVRGTGVGGRVAARRLVRPAEGVRKLGGELYSIGFVDPARWDGGRFPELLALFGDRTRAQARRDLGELTLGGAATELAALRPEGARVDVRFLLDRGRNPIAAVADVSFAGTAIAGDDEVELPVRHRGRYVLRPSPGGWRIVAYDVRRRAPSPAEVKRAVAEARSTPELPRRGPFFILVIGTDARPGQSVARSRADSIHIVGINPKRRAASIVGIPRDSFVPIPGVGTRKINEGTVHGGPALMVRTVERLAGVRIDAYVLTGFAGFRRLVDAAGGIEVRIPYAMSDRNSGAYFKPGPKRLNGDQALAFSRNRYDAPGGDFGRSQNQNRVMIAAFQKLRRELRGDPGAIFPWVLAAGRHVQTDLSLAEVTDLLLAVRSIEPGRIRSRVVSGSGAMVGGQSVIRLGSSAYATFRDLRRDALLGRRA
jgi:LCP family protein required for cell wall assembly